MHYTEVEKDTIGTTRLYGEIGNMMIPVEIFVNEHAKIFDEIDRFQRYTIKVNVNIIIVQLMPTRKEENKFCFTSI